LVEFLTMRRSALLISATFALAALAGSAAADQIDISGLTNANLDNYFNGGVYPQNGGPLTIGGVNFNLANSSGGTGIIQLPGQDFVPSSVVIPVGEAGVTTVYSIVNSAFGQVGEDIGSLTFTGSGGASFTYDFVEGDNVRDHATTFFNDSAPNLFASEDFGGGDHLDVQQILLPVAFAGQTLTSITFASNGDTQGEPFLAALTTAGGVPEPATWAMMLLGFGGIGYALRKRGQAFKTA
jgi:hypothetical protein